MNLVTSPEGALYPWKYITAEGPKTCDDTLARNAYIAAMPWRSHLLKVSQNLSREGVWISMVTLIHTVGIALRTLGENCAMNYRRDPLYLQYSVIMLSQNNVKRLFIRSNRSEGFGQNAHVWKAVCIYLPDNGPQELRFDILVKISLDFKPYDNDSKQGDVPTLYRRISLVQQLALEKVGVGLHATVQATTGKGKAKFYLYQDRGNNFVALLLRMKWEPINKRLKVAVDMAAQLAYLHQQGIVHNDVKGWNYIVMPDETVKIIDFDYSRKKGDPLFSKCTIGTYIFASPELLDHFGDNIQVKNRDPFAWDNFALGLILYNLFESKEHYWFEVTKEYRLLDKYIQRENHDPYMALLGTFVLALERDKYEQDMASDAAWFRQNPEDYLSVVFGLLDPNPRRRMKSAEAHKRLAALLD